MSETSLLTMLGGGILLAMIVGLLMEIKDAAHRARASREEKL